jgi:alpha-N-arabinofuranosidase
LHAYYDPAAYETVDDFLGCSTELDRMIETVTGIVDSVMMRRGGRRRIGLSIDEWNVWHLAAHAEREARRESRGFERAPALAEDTHDLADALVVGCLLITLLRHVDRVSIACQAQLVNVIPAIKTIDGGPAWLQASAYPFADVARWGRGTALRLQAESSPSGAIEATAVHEPVSGALTLFAVNRTAEPLSFDVGLRGFGRLAIEGQTVLTDPDLRASNSADEPRRLVPRLAEGAVVEDGRLSVRLAARSWNVVRLAPRPDGAPGV